MICNVMTAGNKEEDGESTVPLQVHRCDAEADSPGNGRERH